MFRQSIGNQIVRCATHDDLSGVGDLGHVLGPPHCTADEATPGVKLHFAGVDADAQPSAIASTLQLERADNGIGCPGEGGNRTCCLLSAERSHTAVSSDGIVEALRLRTARGALGLGDKERDGAHRQPEVALIARHLVARPRPAHRWERGARGRDLGILGVRGTWLWGARSPVAHPAHIPTSVACSEPRVLPSTTRTPKRSSMNTIAPSSERAGFGTSVARRNSSGTSRVVLGGAMMTAGWVKSVLRSRPALHVVF